MSGVVRRRVMNKPEEKGPIVKTYNLNFSVTAHSSSYMYYFYHTFVVGATYTFDINATGVPKARLNAGIQGNGTGTSGAPEYTSKRIITIKVVKHPDPSRGSVSFADGCNAGTVKFTLTESIPRT